MPESVPKVFISAASRDLRSFRRTVRDSLDCKEVLAVWEEAFSTDYRKITSLIKSKICQCDAMIHVVGFACGELPPEPLLGYGVLSYTQLEFQIAHELRIPIFCFIADDPENLDDPEEQDGNESELKLKLQEKHRQFLLHYYRPEIRYRFNTREDLIRLVERIHFPSMGIPVLPDQLALGEIQERSSYSRFTEASKLWGRVISENDGLAEKVKVIVGLAVAAVENVSEYHPYYHLHGEPHLHQVAVNVENILALSPDIINRMTRMECAICIISAYLHDLVLAPSRKWFQELDVNQSRNTELFEDFRAAYPERLRIWDHWKNVEIEAIKRGDDQLRERALQLLDSIERGFRMEFLRESFCYDDRNLKETVIWEWLERFEKQSSKDLFQFENTNWKTVLCLIVLSIHRDSDWLRNQLTSYSSEKPPFFRLGRHNCALPGVLLRLADAMEFDWVRIPSSTLDQFGYDATHSDFFELWHQQRKYTTVEFFTDEHEEWNLNHAANHISHPVIHKCLEEASGILERELTDAEDELRVQNGEITKIAKLQHKVYSLSLPHWKQPDLVPANREGVPIYQFKDLKFTLQHDQILSLVMGERLYGDPGLCLRELIQNSLDALQLRELRKAAATSDSNYGERFGYVDDFSPSDLKIKVEWGRNKLGEQFIRVTDAGVGMPPKVIEQFFAKVGNSYYRSGDFERERAYLRKKSLHATPISRFGIGILSCFMIASRIELRTNPGNSSQHPSSKVRIPGAGSLFWFDPENEESKLSHQGTEVTLFLKPEFVLLHREDWLDSLREESNYTYRKHAKIENTVETHDFGSSSSVRIRYIDPAATIARSVVWPTHPIELANAKGALEGEEGVTLDDRFHLDVLRPIDTESLYASAKKWGCPSERLGNPGWQVFDWTDQLGDQATGSRIRLIFPTFHPNPHELQKLPEDDGDHLGHIDLATFLHSVRRTTSRQILVKSMVVDDLQAAENVIALRGLVGAGLWLDLRGDAAPPLSASRRYLIDQGRDWVLAHRAIQGVVQRFETAINDLCPPADERDTTNRRRNVCWLWLLKDVQPSLDNSVSVFARMDQDSFGWDRSGAPKTRLYWRWVSLHSMVEILINEKIRRLMRQFGRFDDDEQARLAFGALIKAKQFNDFELAWWGDSVFNQIKDSFSEAGYDREAVLPLGEGVKMPLISYEKLGEKFSNRKVAAIASKLTLDMMVSTYIELVPKLESQKESGDKHEGTTRRNKKRIHKISATKVRIPNLVLAHTYNLMAEYVAERGLIVTPQEDMAKGFRTAPGIITSVSKEDEPIDNPLSIYDFIFPYDFIQLGGQETRNTKVQTLFRLCMSQFLLHNNFPVWDAAMKEVGSAIQEHCGLQKERITVLMPNINSWEKPFSEWNEKDWKQCLSASWNLKNNELKFKVGEWRAGHAGILGYGWEKAKKLLNL